MTTSLEFKTLPLGQVKAAHDGGEFEGLASAFFVIDDSWTCDIVAPGAFKEDLPEFLSRGFVGGTNHNWDEPIGRPVQAEETADGLWVKACISDTTHGRDVRTLLKDGVIRFLSIGFRTVAREYLETSEAVLAWWKGVGYSPTPADVAKAAHGARVLTRVKLFEFSPVAVPANPLAAITGVKSHPAPPSLGGTGLEAHSVAVLAQVEEYAERLAGLKSGELGPEHRAGFRRLRSGLDRLLDGKGAAPPGEAERLAVELELMTARLNGVSF